MQFIKFKKILHILRSNLKITLYAKKVKDINYINKFLLYYFKIIYIFKLL